MCICTMVVFGAITVCAFHSLNSNENILVDNTARLSLISQKILIKRSAAVHKNQTHYSRMLNPMLMTKLNYIPL